jgi:hypothetical protein
MKINRQRKQTRGVLSIFLFVGILSSAFSIGKIPVVTHLKPNAFSSDLNLDENASVWGTYTEVVTPGTTPPTWELNNVLTPSLDGHSLRCALRGGTAYSNVLFYHDLPAAPGSDTFIMTLSFYYRPVSTFNNVGGASIVQALEFTMNKWMRELRYEWALQWQNVGTGGPKWRYWGEDPNDLPGSPKWIDLSISGTLAGQQWHTLKLEGEILAGQIHYQRFTIDGQAHLLSIPPFLPAPAVGWPDKLSVGVQLDGNKDSTRPAQLTPYEVFLDQVNFTSLTEADTVGVFRPSNGIIFLKNSNDTGFADMALNYGLPGDYPVTGDWDENGTDTIGIYRNGWFYLRNSNTIGFADIIFPFGLSGDQPVAGDWDGDGVETIGIYRPTTGQFLLRNSNSEGPADASFFLGNVGDVGIVGDWDGDGKDTTGVFRPINGVIFLKNKNETGFADIALNYGLPGDRPVIGDWNNDGIDTIGIYRNGIFYLRNENTNGFAEIIFALGNPGDMPIDGNWDGLP